MGFCFNRQRMFALRTRSCSPPAREGLVHLPNPKRHRRRNEVIVAHSETAEQPQLLAQGRELLAHCDVGFFERLTVSPWIA